MSLLIESRITGKGSSMTKFAYNNTKNVNTSHMHFELNYDYYLRIIFKDKVYPHSKSRSANELAKELRELMSIC